MCGRYASSRRPEDLVEEFEVDSTQVSAPLAPDYNVAPTKEVYVVLERPPRPPAEPGDSAAEELSAAKPARVTQPVQGTPSQQRQLRTARWGLVPFWAKDPSIGSRMINARVESVAQKPAFRKAFASRRCLVPADGYYEWYTPQPGSDGGKRPPKQPFFIHPPDGGLLAMAGLYEIWRDPTRNDEDPDRFRWTCTVLTTSAADDLGHIHDRMPMFVEKDRYAAWLDPTCDQAADLLSLLVPAAPGRLEAYPVSTQVNNVRNNGPELLDPIAVEP